MNEKQQPEKKKAVRQKSPWLNIYALASKAMGNRVGVITNTMSSALAAGMPDLAFDWCPNCSSKSTV